MSLVMSQRCLQLALDASQALPVELSWQIKQGYVHAKSWTEQGDLMPLGIWGPGDLVIPDRLTIQPVELRALSGLMVQECCPNSLEVQAFEVSHIQQMSLLFRLSRIRPAEKRLFILLKWLGDRFGQPSCKGLRLPLAAMNLTHRQLGDLSSMTRVTVTKTLSLFRQQGWLVPDRDEELLTEAAITDFQRRE